MNHRPNISLGHLPWWQRTRNKAGFTLIELCLSMVILAIIMMVSVQVLDQTQRTWKRGVATIEQFREARMAFETITQNTRQAMLNTYLTYRYNNGTTPTVPETKTQAPMGYMRQSELQFVTGQSSTLLGNGGAGGGGGGAGGANLAGHAMFFQARLGLSERDGYQNLKRLLCGRGYFIMHSSDEAFRPQHVQQVRSRFRLWEYRPPSERNYVYSSLPGQWFQNALSNVITVNETADAPAYSRPIAENIVALIISPQVTTQDAKLAKTDPWWIAPNYNYDSSVLAHTNSTRPQGTQHMLPPRVVVTLVAIDESSARKLAEANAESTPKIIPEGAFIQCSKYQEDMDALEAALRAQKLNYRIFSSTITLRNSKWGIL